MNRIFATCGVITFASCTILYIHKCAFYETIENMDRLSPVRVTVADVRDAIAALKNTKSPGPNGVHVEAFKYSGVRLWMHLSLFYTFCLCHSYAPDNFIIRSVCVIVMHRIILCLSVSCLFLRTNVATLQM